MLFGTMLKAGTEPKLRSVQLSATISGSQLTVNIAPVGISNTTITSYNVYRKLKGASTFTLYQTLAGSATSFSDVLSAGDSYEYKVIRTATRYGATKIGKGYIHSGKKLPTVTDRGIILLVIDQTSYIGLWSSIYTLEKDLRGEGWTPKRIYVARNSSVTSVKAKIKTEYNKDTANTKSVFLIGHVPVPYSGNINPDGHSNHRGAWAADVYYADMDGVWTDATVNNTSASKVANRNVPGDGKFDQSKVPGNGVELQIGRVDLYDMPAFGLSELQLLKNYFLTNHNYRVKNYSTVHRALVFDHFGTQTQGTGGYANFAPLVGQANVSNIDYISNLTARSYQWSYADAGGLGNYLGFISYFRTIDFHNNDIKGTFTALFGSYFGDWNNTNDFLRAPLCNGTTLVNFWGARPCWSVHPMGMGEVIGYCAKNTQNDRWNNYSRGFYKSIHIALMGDPTLRDHIIAPAKNLYTSNKTSSNFKLNWTASTDNVLGYNIYAHYRKDQSYSGNSPDKIVKLNSSIVNATSYTLTSCLDYHYKYCKIYVRAVKLETTPSGTYYNESTGVEKFINYRNYSFFNYTLNGNNVSFYGYAFNPSYNSSSIWIFGDGSYSFNNTNITHTYASAGTYTVKFYTYGNCGRYSIEEKTIVIPPSSTPMIVNDNNNSLADKNESEIQLRLLEEEIGKPINLDNQLNKVKASISVYPNPSHGDFNVMLSSGKAKLISVYSSTGKKVYEQNVNTIQFKVELETVSPGLYLVEIIDEFDEVHIKKIIVK